MSSSEPQYLPAPFFMDHGTYGDEGLWYPRLYTLRTSKNKPAGITLNIDDRGQFLQREDRIQFHRDMPLLLNDLQVLVDVSRTRDIPITRLTYHPLPGLSEAHIQYTMGVVLPKLQQVERVALMGDLFLKNVQSLINFLPNLKTLVLDGCIFAGEWAPVEWKCHKLVSIEIGQVLGLTRSELLSATTTLSSIPTVRTIKFLFVAKDIEHFDATVLQSLAPIPNLHLDFVANMFEGHQFNPNESICRVLAESNHHFLKSLNLRLGSARIQWNLMRVLIESNNAITSISITPSTQQEDDLIGIPFLGLRKNKTLESITLNRRYIDLTLTDNWPTILAGVSHNNALRTLIADGIAPQPISSVLRQNHTEGSEGIRWLHCCAKATYYIINSNKKETICFRKFCSIIRDAGYDQDVNAIYTMLQYLTQRSQWTDFQDALSKGSDPSSMNNRKVGNQAVPCKKKIKVEHC